MLNIEGAAGTEVCEGALYTEVDSQVRFVNKKHRIVLEESPEPYDDPEATQGNTHTDSEGDTTDTDVSGGGTGVGTHSHSGTKSEAQTMVESMATSVLQLTQAMQNQATAIALQSQAQSRALTAVVNKATRDKVKLSLLKVKVNRTRPTVKAVRAWLQDIAEKLYTVAGLPAAIAALKRQPLILDRVAFTAMVDKEDDRIMYQSVRSTMSEVYQMMVDSDGREELQSAMGLMHDAMQFSLCKGDT